MKKMVLVHFNLLPLGGRIYADWEILEVTRLIGLWG
jgi:hypothetical protein